MSESSACERVGRLRGVTWRWRADAPDGLAGLDMGVLAQEVEEVLPGLVREGPDGYLVVDYGGLVVELLAAVVELDQRAEHLQAAAADPGASPAACEIIARLAPGEPDSDGVRRLDPERVADLLPGAVRPHEHGRPQIAHHTLVAPLIEAVKDLDTRLTPATEPPSGSSGDSE